MGTIKPLVSETLHLIAEFIQEVRHAPRPRPALPCHQAGAGQARPGTAATPLPPPCHQQTAPDRCMRGVCVPWCVLHPDTPRLPRHIAVGTMGSVEWHWGVGVSVSPGVFLHLPLGLLLHPLHTSNSSKVTSLCSLLTIQTSLVTDLILDTMSKKCK